MTAKVLLRINLPGCRLWNSNGAGGLQRKARYRHECGNSHHRTNHRTITHVQLSHACLKFRFYRMEASTAWGSSPILGFRKTYTVGPSRRSPLPARKFIAHNALFVVALFLVVQVPAQETQPASSNQAPLTLTLQD